MTFFWLIALTLAVLYFLLGLAVYAVAGFVFVFADPRGKRERALERAVAINRLGATIVTVLLIFMMALLLLIVGAVIILLLFAAIGMLILV